jgi:hypothetical protein
MSLGSSKSSIPADDPQDSLKLSNLKPQCQQDKGGLSGELRSDTRRRQDIFFNENIPLSELRKIAGLDEDDGLSDVGEVWRSTKHRYCLWMSQSCATVSCSAYNFHKQLQAKFYKTLDDLQLTPPPPGFRDSPTQIQPKSLSRALTCDSISSSVENPRKLLMQTEAIELGSPPKKKGLCKREDRGKFIEENITPDRHTGTLKFYQLKKRFGFITLDEDETDVFLCEDDIVLSGIHHKHFKDTVLHKNALHFSFRIKTYEEQGRIKRKAIEIKLVS